MQVGESGSRHEANSRQIDTDFIANGSGRLF
jgi:hypothetical protein